ncbi:MAG TPA: hypothetical protein VGO84_02675 [Burkholderiales bacterium]|nr:hypothetical protein [Burkholderiales bacterium]
MPAAGSSSPWYGGFRLALFALLAANAACYFYAGTLSKGLDALAWLILLALFALETGFSGNIRAPRAAMRFARLIAAAGVCAAGIAYIIERNTLDAINTGLWIAVVVLLELEVRHPHAVKRYRLWFSAAASVLYAALGVLVLAWGWRREWFDAYDALLWLLAFATIEMDVLNAGRAA